MLKQNLEEFRKSVRKDTWVEIGFYALFVIATGAFLVWYLN